MLATAAVMLLLTSLVSDLVLGIATCPILDTTRIVYSTVPGVGPASNIWVSDFLSWWQAKDHSVNFQALSAEDMQTCDLQKFPNLRVYINPGGDAYQQLSSLGKKGTKHIKDFVLRDQKDEPSAYVGFCAGGYIASHDYLWETVYEGPGYYEYAFNPPLSLFPHTVEGSIVDINDDQYGDQMNSKFRTVNVSNGHTMLYYGGSTFGWNGVPSYVDKESSEYDPDLEVLIYYSDFYGFYSPNIPAAWKYQGNILLTSVHPEADECTTEQNYDCPPAGTLSSADVERNRGWLAHYINEVAQTSFWEPTVQSSGGALLPSYNTSAPHIVYPVSACYRTTVEALKESSSGSSLLFCDDFNAEEGSVPAGLSVQFQRNQSDFQKVRPWNTTFIDTWNGGMYYAAAFEGNGYAVAVPQAESTPEYTAVLTSRSFSIPPSCTNVGISYAYISAIAEWKGYLGVEYSQDGGNIWTSIAYHGSSQDRQWASNKVVVPVHEASSTSDRAVAETAVFPLQGEVRFTCAAGPSITSFCALDSLSVSCA